MSSKTVWGATDCWPPSIPTGADRFLWMEKHFGSVGTDVAVWLSDNCCEDIYDGMLAAATENA